MLCRIQGWLLRYFTSTPTAPWVCSAGCKDDFRDVWLQRWQHHGHQRVWNHHQQPAPAGQECRCHQDRLQGTTWVSILPVCMSISSFSFFIVVIGVLYMPYPDGCRHVLTLLPRLRPYPMSEHAATVCLHEHEHAGCLSTSSMRHLQLTIALHVWCSLLFMFVFMSIACPAGHVATLHWNICQIMTWARTMLNAQAWATWVSFMWPLPCMCDVCLVHVSPLKKYGAFRWSIWQTQKNHTLCVCVWLVPRNCPHG